MSFAHPYAFASAEEVEQIVRGGKAGKDWAIVDVRDDDFVGGNIPGAINLPSQQLEERLPELVDLVKDVPRVIFHCALSQARGPKAARIYAEERAKHGRSTLLTSADAQSTPPVDASATAESIPDPVKSANILPNPFHPSSIPPPPADVQLKSHDSSAAVKVEPSAGESKTGETKDQEVIVLRGGFTQWQAKYRNDPQLVEKFDKDLWDVYG